MAKILISEEMKRKLKILGRKGDSYDDIIKRMYEDTRKNLLRNYLYDMSGSIIIDDAIKEAKTA